MKRKFNKHESFKKSNKTDLTYRKNKIIINNNSILLQPTRQLEALKDSLNSLNGLEMIGKPMSLKES